MLEIASAKLSIDPALLPSTGTRVLDVGCGDGRHLRAAGRRGCRSVGVDFDVAELRKARQAAPRADLVVADATRLPFRDASFDAVICTETLEHLPDDRNAMRQIARVLRPDGSLLGAVPSHFTESLYFRLSSGYRNAPGGHVRIYTPMRLFSALRDAGLHVSSFKYIHFIDSLVWLRFSVVDAIRPSRPSDDFTAAVLLAIAQERPVARWRAELRRQLARSWFIGQLDRFGALFWPKSLTFVARKEVVCDHQARREAE